MRSLARMSRLGMRKLRPTGGRARRGRARAAPRRDRDARPGLGHDRRLAAVGGGLPGDWDPACATTHLTYDAGDDVWQGTFALPAGGYEYKAALNNAWDENYGLHAVLNGGNIPTSLASAGSVKFYYDHKSHWATDNKSSVIATAAGSFQSELGCPGDWDPDCLRSWLQDPDGDGIYTFETTALPAGSYETKVAINESWDVNYGAGGVPERRQHPVRGAVRQRADHVQLRLGLARAHDHAARCARGAAPSRTSTWRARTASAPPATRRRRCGTRSRTASSATSTTRRSTTRTSRRSSTSSRDGSTFTDLQTRDMTYTAEAVHDVGGMACKVTATAKSGKYKIETEYITDPSRNTVLMRVAFSPKKSGLRLYVRFDPTVNGNGGGGAGQRRRRLGDGRQLDRSPGARLLRSGHGDERGQPRLRAARLRRARRLLLGGLERLRRRRRATVSSNSMPRTP